MAGKEGERPGQLIVQNNNQRQEAAGNHEGRQTGTQLAPLMEQEVFEKLSFTPPGEDPAFWPFRVLGELNHCINARVITNDFAYRAIGEKYAPYQEIIRNVKTAYAILAHPHCKDWTRQVEIQAALEIDREMNGKEEVELADNELHVLSKLTAARNIPFDPKKRVYSYSEVPLGPILIPLEGAI